MSFIDNIKEVANVVRKADNIDLFRQILDLQQEALELIQENNELKIGINELKKKDNISDRLFYQDNKYYLQDEDEKEGPFCSVCWDVRNKLVRMHESEYGYLCLHCLELNKSK